MVSIPVCLSFLSVMVVSSPHLTLSSLIFICTSLLLRCLLWGMYSNLFNMVIMLSPSIYRMLIYIFLLLSVIIIFLWFVWWNMPHQWKVLPFGLAAAPRVFTALTKPVLFLCHHKGFCIVIFLGDILVLVCSKWAGKRAPSFWVSLLICFGLHINFSKSDLHLTQTSCFLEVMLGYCPYVSIFAIW